MSVYVWLNKMILTVDSFYRKPWNFFTSFNNCLQTKLFDIVEATQNESYWTKLLHNQNGSISGKEKYFADDRSK